MERTLKDEDIRAPVIALDLGEKRVGVAVSDALSISITRLAALPRTNWKQLVKDVIHLVESFDAKTVVIGLPLSLDGTFGDAAEQCRRSAQKFARTLAIPVYLQDERLSSVEAEANLAAMGQKPSDISRLVDSEAAAVILRDFLQPHQQRILISRI